jgi:hypothetical protein
MEGMFSGEEGLMIVDSPFLDFVSNTTTFDEKFSEYIKEEYVTFK